MTNDSNRYLPSGGNASGFWSLSPGYIIAIFSRISKASGKSYRNVFFIGENIFAMGMFSTVSGLTGVIRSPHMNIIMQLMSRPIVICPYGELLFLCRPGCVEFLLVVDIIALACMNLLLPLRSWNIGSSGLARNSLCHCVASSAYSSLYAHIAYECSESFPEISHSLLMPF